MQMFMIRFLNYPLKKRAIVSLFFVTILVLFFSHPYTWADSDSTKKVKKDIRRGKRDYKKYCSSCHGISGEGGGSGAIISGIPPQDLTDKAYMSLLSDEELFERIRYGEDLIPYVQMPGIVHKASKQTMWNIAYYVRTLAVNKGPLKGPTPKERAERFKDPLERGRIYYLRYCSPCHGKTGDGTGWAARTLDGVPVAHNDPIVMAGFTRQQIFKHVKGLKAKRDRSMPIFGKAFVPRTVKVIAAYTKTLSANLQN